MLLFLSVTACTAPSKKPVMYPNAKSTTVGQAQMARDVEDCMALARQYGVSDTRQNNVGRDTATGALIGGASAGAWGLVRGDAADRALAGAAAGAAAGATRGVIRASENKPNPTFQRFVQRCLRERGYEVIGWE